jgi:hypothetical protein
METWKIFLIGLKISMNHTIIISEFDNEINFLPTGDFK